MQPYRRTEIVRSLRELVCEATPAKDEYTYERYMVDKKHVSRMTSINKDETDIKMELKYPGASSVKQLISVLASNSEVLVRDTADILIQKYEAAKKEDNEEQIKKLIEKSQEIIKRLNSAEGTNPLIYLIIEKEIKEL